MDSLAVRLGSAAAPLGVTAVLVWIAWGHLGGGFSALRWGPLAVALTAALALAAIVAPPALRERSRIGALIALAGFVGWNFLSLAWADFPGDAWIGADKSLVYAVSCAAFALWPWTRGAATLVLGLYVAGVALVGAVTLVQAARATELFGTFADGRLLGSVEYVNGSVGFWTSAFFPAMYLAARRDLNPAARGAYLACGTLVLQLSFLGQSRGWFVVFPVAFLLFVVLARERLRLLVAVAIVAAATFAIHGRLFDVFATWRAENEVARPFDAAARAVVLACLAVAVAGLLWALVDRRWELGARATRRASVATLAAAVALVVAAGVAAGRAVEDPAQWASDRWSEFTSGDYPTDEEGTRFTGAASTNRFAYWAVAWRQFEEHPITGIGADNFGAQYLLARENADYEPSSPHSTPLRLLSQLGLVGTALFAVFVTLLVRLALVRRRTADPATGGAVAASLAVFAYWFLHGSVDWFWEIPALAAPAFGFLGFASAVDDEADVGRHAHSSWLARGGVAVALVAALGALVPPWLSEAYEEAARSRWRSDPQSAYDAVDRAAALNPLAADPLLLEGHVALTLRDGDRAGDAIAQALEREPSNWYAHLQLALLASSRRDFDLALRAIERAQALNPQDPVLAYVHRRVVRRQTVDVNAVTRRYLDIFDQRIGRT